MVNPTFNPVPRSEAATAAMGTPPVFPRSTSQAMPQPTMENIMGLLCELKTRFDEREARDGVPHPSSRPEPVPPQGAHNAWQAPPWPSGGQSVWGPGPTYSTAPVVSVSAPTSMSATGMGVRPPLGFRHPPPGPTSVPSLQPYSSWDVAPPRSTWEPAQQRQQPPCSTPEPSRFIRMDPPVFDGSDATGWLTRVEYYFNHIQLPPEQRLHYAVMLFAPPATDWIFAYRTNNPVVTWEQFVDDVRRRFDPHYFVNHMELLAKLTQTGLIADYNKDFERLMNKITGVSEATFLSIYLGGLRNPLKSHVRFQHPLSVASAMAIAVEYDSAGERSTATARRQWPNREFRPSSSPTQQASGGEMASGSAAAGGAKPRDYTKLPVVRVTTAEKAERTRLGLCWYCAEKWATGHVCKGRFLAYMGSDGEEDDEIELPTAAPTSGDVVGADLSHMYSLDGRSRPRALEFQGFLGSEQVFILVDSGSSHNFLHPRIAERTKLELEEITPFRVYVGNGQSLTCSNVATRTEIRIQGHTLELDLHILPIYGPDIILGLPWLSSLQRVTSDYGVGTLEFLVRGRPVCLKVTPRSARQISANKLAWIMLHQEGVDCFEVIPVDGSSKEGAVGFNLAEDIPLAVRDVISKFASVFSVPSGLPPSRAFDHRIHLLPGTKPVNVRPYRYPYYQKSEIERQVREMLDGGIIRRSCSAFSSPVLLIRKKDGSFRFCIDYRALNNVTVADHFPIPTADELFDELGEARVFTKLDLRSGYHQIRMNEEDVYKTAFRTHDGHFEFLVMPFGLTNAPSTFQAAMNEIFRPLLCSFVIVFFDDILIYSKSIPEHAEHLREVFTVLQTHNFYIKLSKCTFCCTSVEYLGHIVSNGHLKADPSKLEAMDAWPTPTSPKKLRGFLGLTGYYRKFIARYSILAAPLTDLLKKNAFVWTPEAESSFAALKAAMVSAPILRLPNFDKHFCVETDASDFGVGAVLLQEEHPIAFFSKKLGPRRRVASTYHKELYAIVEAVQKWRQYLLGREFVIRSDQKSLKELLQQVVQTPDQQLYVRKLMGYKFRIEYKTGASNRVADALSRRDGEEDSTAAPTAVPTAETLAECISLFLAMAHPIPEVMEVLRKDIETLPDLIELQAQIRDGTAAAHFHEKDGLIFKDIRIMVGVDSQAKLALLYEYHSTPSAGHPGVERTFRRLAASFYWAGMRRDVKKFVAACYDCQTTKYSTQKPGGLLQPLPIPSHVWDEASMDFITGLPQSRGFTAIMVVVDRFSKYAHFAPLPTRFDAWRVANVFVETVVKHHGFPRKLVSDRDSVFLNEVWENLLKLSGTKLQFSTAYHPQTDGQTEVRNRGLEQYLRAFVADRPNKWTSFLPWAELALNCFHHEGLGTSPFHALYGREPPPLVAASPSANCPPSVADVIRQRGELLVWLRRNLEKAQQRMRVSANKHRREVEFKVGDRVLLKLQLYRQHSVARPLSQKLSRRFYGPFTIVERIGAVAYRLELPEGSKIHNVFHVSLLRPFVDGETAGEAEFPAVFVRGRVMVHPRKIVDQRRVWRHGEVMVEGLVEWEDDDGQTPTWEPVELLRRKFPSLFLEDKERHKEGGVDTTIVSTVKSSEDRREAEPELRHEPELVTYETTEKVDEASMEEGRVGRSTRRVRPPKRYEDFVPHH